MMGPVRTVTAWVAVHPVASFIVFFAVFPFLVPYQSLATQVLIFVVMAVVLLVRPSGLFGEAGLAE